MATRLGCLARPGGERNDRLQHNIQQIHVNVICGGCTCNLHLICKFRVNLGWITLVET